MKLPKEITNGFLIFLGIGIYFLLMNVLGTNFCFRGFRWSRVLDWSGRCSRMPKRRRAHALHRTDLSQKESGP